jgi:UDP-2,3-diacylglucosamine pyrophosphatase LpxH
VIVISDVHLSASGDTGQGLFQAGAALEEFLTWVFQERRGSIFVLNGDIFDYLFLKDSNGATPTFNENTLIQETKTIIESHAKVLNALRKLACSSHHQFVIIAGNHDPELIFPAVQETIEAALTSRHRRPRIKWITNGQALSLRIGPVRALIEHGNSLDDWNDIDYESLRSAVSLATRGLIAYHSYEPPPGSKLVTEHLSRMRRDYPWVELLKPERDAALPLLRHLTSVRYKTNFLGSLKSYADAVTKAKITALRETYDPATRFRKAGELSIGAKMRRMANEILEGRGEQKRADLIRQLKRVALTDGFFNVSTPERNLARDLKFLLQRDANLLIHGHTHSAKAYQVGKGAYFNSGTWAQLLGLPDPDAAHEDWNRFVNDLENGKYCAFARPTFVRVSLETTSTARATLHEWGKAAPLANWLYSEKTNWRTNP